MIFMYTVKLLEYFTEGMRQEKKEQQLKRMYLHAYAVSATQRMDPQPLLSSPCVLVTGVCLNLLRVYASSRVLCGANKWEAPRGGEVTSMLHNPTGVWCRVAPPLSYMYVQMCPATQILAAVNILCSKSLNPH